jgi:hypothetical protein
VTKNCDKWDKTYAEYKQMCLCQPSTAEGTFLVMSRANNSMTGIEIKHYAQLIIVFADSMKPKPSIEQIKITHERLNELKYLLKRPGLSNDGKNNLIRKYVGGVCWICGSLPTKILTYDVVGAKLIERYCDKCFKKWEEPERTFEVDK